MEFVLDGDPQAFAAAVEPFLAARVECNLLATVLMSALAGRYPDGPPVLVRGLDDDGALAAVALRVAPWRMICSELDASAAGGLIDLWLTADPGLNGVNSLAPTARALASAWARRTGGETQCAARTAFHSLTEVVDPPRPGAGRLVVAGARQRPLLIAWWTEFAAEAGVRGGTAEATRAVDAGLRDHRLWLWESPGGEPMSMVQLQPRVGGIVRVGPVFTPPPHRRRGYAGAAVAAVSRRALADGARGCALFTDLENPTSNKIYAEVGYRRLADWEEHAFTPA